MTELPFVESMRPAFDQVNDSVTGKQGSLVDDFCAVAPPCVMKCGLIIVAWTAALLAMFPLWGLIMFGGPWLVLLFPAGLWLSSDDGKANPARLLVGWALYLAVMVLVMMARKRWLFVLFYVVLCAMLAINVVGCYRIVNANLEGIE